jgi:hemerythrin-like metal-binding protein
MWGSNQESEETPISSASESRSSEGSNSSYSNEVLKNFLNLNFSESIDSQKCGSQETYDILSKLQDKLSFVMSEILINSKLITGASTSLNNTSKSIRDQVVHISKYSSEVSDTTSEMNANMGTVSAATEELSINMQTISDAASISRDHVNMISQSTSELTDAAKEIAVSTDRATQVSKRAQDRVNSTSEKVSSLEAAALEIDMVTSTISEISDQTKLLALNATIEAARAGEAGKGFAVVAKEVKDLALQTNEATRNIQKKIAIIQEATKEATSAMVGISDVINEVDDVITTIAAASEEQSVTTNNIAQSILDTTSRIDEMTTNVEQGALAVQDVNVSISDSAKLAQDIAESLVEVDKQTTKAMSDAVSTYALALEVSSHNDEMGRNSNQFTIKQEHSSAVNNAVPALCRFTQSYDVRVNQFNNDHIRIFDYINEVHKQVKDGVDISVIVQTLKNLGTFTTEHFAREEEKFVSTNYPTYSEHKDIHEKLLAQVRDTIVAIENGEEVDLIAVLIFLKKWLVDHIMGTDKKYGGYLNERGIS